MIQIQLPELGRFHHVSDLPEDLRPTSTPIPEGVMFIMAPLSEDEIEALGFTPTESQLKHIRHVIAGEQVALLLPDGRSCLLSYSQQSAQPHDWISTQTGPQ